MKPARQQLYSSFAPQLPAPDNTGLLRRHLSNSSSKRQSRVRLQYTRTDEAVSGTIALPSEGHCYDSFPNVTDTYNAESLQDIAVRLWLYHHHFI